MIGATRVAMVAARAQPEIGGIESHVAEVATRLVREGVDVEVLTTDRTGRLPRVERVDGYVVRRFRAFPRRRDWYLSPGLFWALLRSRHDLVHVQGIHTLVPPVAMLAALLRRVPYLLTFHSGGSSSAFRERARGPQFRLLAPLLRRADALVGVSGYEARRFQQFVGPSIRVRLIRNGGGLPRLVSAIAPDPDLVLSVGRLERYKGHHRVVEALPHLLAARPDARVEILGSGPYEDELLALAERLGVADRVSVRFVPPVERAAMARSLAGAGVVALLSDYEAHPVAVMEALVAGRPVVVSRTSGLTELADLGWARGVEPDADPAVVAAALEEQLSTPVRPSPVELPTWESCVESLLEVYREVLPAAVRPSEAS
ncbi:glycosyltransferase family 4 protein [Nocardioides dongkuii]|uniref:glycosyltransferase family 4 protein n=1 Tax=Nocardioides dongkuii TaxID=2760089 RepID=UPI001878B81E|nr:glycosyltransferase family 4 protein [Nocardioides dongkuii]